ncbi:MAG: beta-glycosidase, partial [Muribaculaceae bacterium]|nr:beta-glycosidase [Muribaculaceae bacterium]
MKKSSLLLCCMLSALGASAQTATWFSSTENAEWQKQKNLKLSDKPESTPLVTVDNTSKGHTLKHWGTTFNELDWDAFLALSREEQDALMHN